LIIIDELICDYDTGVCGKVTKYSNFAVMKTNAAFPPIGLLLALVVFCAGAVWGTVHLIRPQMDERMYARFRRLPQADASLPTADSSAAWAQAWAVGAQHFNDKNYHDALDSMRVVMRAAPDHEGARFFAALCLLECVEMPAATQLLTPLRQDTASRWQQEATWYLALARLRNHDRAGCLRLLDSMEPTGVRRVYADTLTLKLR
jgi:hypothetical protein